MKNWKAIGALIALVALIYFMVFHWGRFLQDFYPLDASRIAPNVVASAVQWAIIAILVALLYPPARRAIERFAQHHVESIKSHVTEEHERLHKRLDHHNAKLNHIILNSDSIPNEVPGVPAEHQPK